MDDNTLYVVFATLVVAVFGISVDALSESFDLHPAAWGFLTAILTLLGLFAGRGSDRKEERVKDDT